MLIERLLWDCWQPVADVFGDTADQTRAFIDFVLLASLKNTPGGWEFNKSDNKCATIRLMVILMITAVREKKQRQNIEE